VGGVRRWFLPESPDLLGLLGEQGKITISGMDALAAWAKGRRSEEAAVRSFEHEADKARRAVLEAVRHSFVTPIGPEDAYELSERLDSVLNSAKNLVREAEVLGMEPDAAMAEMTELLALGVRELVGAFPILVSHPDRATEYANAAVHRQRGVEHVYRRAMSGLLDVDEIREVTGRRELYRRCARIGDAVESVAHRIWYAVVKAE
jgi:uncharacterized protein Yka (UPF0111/DUF47 family)